MSLSVWDARIPALKIFQMLPGGIVWATMPSQFGGINPILQRPHALRADEYPHPRTIDSTLALLLPYG
jgi:hypothetical protein